MRLNFHQAAQVIAHRERRSYSHNALLDLIKRKRLVDCVVWDADGKAVAIKGEVELMDEFDAKVQKRQRKPASVLDRAPDRTPRSTGSDDLPDYNESRARTEFERANLLELERRQKEGLLIERKVVETTWATIITTSKTKILGIPSRIRQRIPHLTLEEVQLITELVEETLEELSQEAEGET
jgi:phage terminase Nu1 subunit (DNA packaging protein)